MPRVTIYWPDPDLWPRIQAAARRASVSEGRDVSASEWLARAAYAALREVPTELEDDDDESDA